MATETKGATSSMAEWRRFVKAELERTERLTAATLERILRLREQGELANSVLEHLRGAEQRLAALASKAVARG